MWGGQAYPVTVLNLPSVVESYKTLDDVNLVKTCDIGQVRGGQAGWAPATQLPTVSHCQRRQALRRAPIERPGRPPCTVPCNCASQVLVVGDDPELLAEAATGEARDGVTPPMRNARERIFRKPIDVPPHVVQKVEFDLLTILAVSRAAPQRHARGGRARPTLWLVRGLRALAAGWCA